MKIKNYLNIKKTSLQACFIMLLYKQEEDNSSSKS